MRDYRQQPIATLGDIMNWRAELREAGIERRPPPSNDHKPVSVAARPDRGHIEQPGERPPPPPPAAQRPLPEQRSEVRIIRALPGFLPTASDLPAPTLRRVVEVAAVKEAPPAKEQSRPAFDKPLIKLERMAAPPEPRVPNKVIANRVKRPQNTSSVDARGRQHRTLEFREAAALRALCIAAETPDLVRSGANARVAREIGIGTSNVSNWVAQYKTDHPNWKQLVADARKPKPPSNPPPPPPEPPKPESTLLSRPEPAPMSTPQPTPPASGIQTSTASAPAQYPPQHVYTPTVTAPAVPPPPPMYPPQPQPPHMSPFMFMPGFAEYVNALVDARVEEAIQRHLRKAFGGG